MKKQRRQTWKAWQRANKDEQVVALFKSLHDARRNVIASIEFHREMARETSDFTIAGNYEQTADRMQALLNELALLEDDGDFIEE